MELIICADEKVASVSIMQKENKLTSANRNIICFSLVSGTKYMHLKNLLHNELKSNNVLLKLGIMSEYQNWQIWENLL